MNFNIDRKNEIYMYDTHVENLFIGEFMSQAPGEFVKVYLYALMYAELRLPMDNATVARETGLSAEEVERAWVYWEKKGVIKRTCPDPEDRSRYETAFLRLREQVYHSGAARDAAEENAEERELKEIPNSRIPGAYAESFSDATLQRMYSAIERITGRMFDAKEPQAILSWIEEGAEPDGIVEAYRYCASIRKNTRPSYVGAIVREWAEKGIKTPEQIAAHLAESDARHNRYRRVMRALGFARQPGEEERRIMDTWFDELGCQMDEVLEACKKTSGISNPNINYVNKVLIGTKKGSEPQTKEKPTAGSDAIRRRREAYDQLRQRHAAELEERRNAILEQIPRIGEIEQEAHQWSMKLSGLVLGGGSSSAAVQQVREQLEQLEAEKTALLQQHHVDASALEMEYTCELCHDTGFLDDGTRCSCF